MSVKDIFAIAASIILSVGGSGALICALSKFLAERIANRIDKKYQQRIDQELEKYRMLLNIKNMYLKRSLIMNSRYISSYRKRILQLL